LVALWRWCLPAALLVCCKPFDSPIYFAHERALRFNAWVNDHFGRKAGFWSVGVLTIVGAVILSAAENVGTSLPFSLAISSKRSQLCWLSGVPFLGSVSSLANVPRASSYLFSGAWGGPLTFLAFHRLSHFYAGINVAIVYVQELAPSGYRGGSWPCLCRRGGSVLRRIRCRYRTLSQCSLLCCWLGSSRFQLLLWRAGLLISCYFA
jgi:hypothetical protein